MNFAEDFEDRVTERDLILLRYSAYMGARIQSYLDTLERAANEQLWRVNPASGRTHSAQLKRVRTVVDRITPKVGETYREIQSQTITGLRELAVLEAAWLARTVNTISDANLFKSLPVGEISKLVNNGQVMGVPFKENWKRQALKFVNVFEDNLRMSVFAGDGVSGMQIRLFGTARRRWKDGALAVMRNNAFTISDNSIRSVVDLTRYAMYRQHGEKVRAVQAVNPLDNKTSVICRARAGGIWSLATGRAMKQSAYPGRFPGPPPWHWGCRTTLIPLMVPGDYRTKKGRIRKMDGRFAKNQGFETWLKKRPETEQLKLLGPGRFGLWKKGKIGMKDLINQRGRPLTLKELAEQ